MSMSRLSRRLYSTTPTYKDLIYYSIQNKTIDPVQFGYEAMRIGCPYVLKDLSVIIPHIYKDVAVRSYCLGDDTTYSRVQSEIEENMM